MRRFVTRSRGSRDMSEWFPSPDASWSPSAGHSAAAVVGKATREGLPWYYLDDGIYGSFGARVFDGIHYPLSALPAKSGRTGGETAQSFGRPHL